VTIDRAVGAADAYLARKNDVASRQAVDSIRKRAVTFRTARARFAALEQKARAGASTEEISQSLMGIGMLLSVSK
jgi:hypothetical protein